MYLKEKSEDFQTFALLAYPKEKANLIFALLECNDYLEFEDPSLLARLVLVYWNVQLKRFEDALKIALSINVSVSVLNEEEKAILLLIENNQYRDIEAKLICHLGFLY